MPPPSIFNKLSSNPIKDTIKQYILMDYPGGKELQKENIIGIETRSKNNTKGGDYFIKLNFSNKSYLTININPNKMNYFTNKYKIDGNILYEYNYKSLANMNEERNEERKKMMGNNATKKYP